MKVKFKEWNCDIDFGLYPNGRIGFGLVEFSDEFQMKEPIATCTINLPNHDIKYGYVGIKNYSENEGMLDALIEAGIVNRPLFTLEQGFVEIPICEVTDKAMELMVKQIKDENKA